MRATLAATVRQTRAWRSRKIPVFGLLERGGKVYARVFPDAKSHTLKPIMERKIVPNSIVYSDTFHSYDVLDVAGFKHLRINHSKLFSENKNHINGIESFWNRPSVTCAASMACRGLNSTSS